jgi:hypothetical protein
VKIIGVFGAPLIAIKTCGKTFAIYLAEAATKSVLGVNVINVTRVCQ